MQPAQDQYGNYQSVLAGNGIYATATGSIMPWFYGHFSGAQPPFSPGNPAAGAYDLDTGQLWEWNGSIWTEITGGGSGTVQVLGGSAPDPNVAGILPTNQTLEAIYKQDPALGQTNTWFWSTSAKIWYQFSA